MPWELRHLLGAATARDALDELDVVARLNSTVNAISSPRAKVSALETCWYMRNQLLRDTDWASMAHSVEIRTPFVDLSLLRTVASALSSRNPYLKQDLARTPLKPLPDAITARAKTGFTIPVRDWLLVRSSQLKANPAAQRWTPAATRGLRAWAQQVYAAFSGKS